MRSRVDAARLELEEAQLRIQTERIRARERALAGAHLATVSPDLAASGEPGVAAAREDTYAEYYTS